MSEDKKRRPSRKRQPASRGKQPKRSVPKSNQDTKVKQKERFSELARNPELFEQVYENSIEVDNTNLKKSFQNMLRKNKTRRKQKENG